MNNDPALTVKIVDLVSVVNELRKAGRVRPSAKVTLSFDGQSLTIGTPNAKVALPASGHWPGKARLDMRVLMALTAAPPGGETLVLNVHPCRFAVGGFVCGCTWQKEKASLLAGKA